MNTLIAPRVPVGLIQPLTLDGGDRLIVRPLLPQDEAAEQAFVMGLSPASRYRRFHVGLRALPPTALRQLVHVDHARHVALVVHATGDDHDEPAILADARYVRTGVDEAEFAIAVADGWQRRGLGRRLLALLARHAARHGVRRLHGDVLADNVPMVRLLEHLGCSVTSRGDEAGVLLATIEL